MNAPPRKLRPDVEALVHIPLKLLAKSARLRPVLIRLFLRQVDPLSGEPHQVGMGNMLPAHTSIPPGRLPQASKQRNVSPTRLETMWVLLLHPSRDDRGFV